VIELGINTNSSDSASSDAPATSAEAKKWADIYKQAFRQTLEDAEGPAATLK
ncbi:hypothetical protein C0993_001397, partial [Termitomyces sp. T159_Od127]